MANESNPPRQPEGPQNSPPSGEAKKEAQPEGWISRLAKRSTGLPSDETPVSKSELQGDLGPWRFAGLGIQFALTVALFAFIGYAIDQKMGWSPWGIISLVLVAVIGNLYLLIKESLKEDKPAAKKK